MPDRIATARQSGEESSLREKVARAIEPILFGGLPDDTCGPVTSRRREEARRQADAAIAVCMEEAARVLVERQELLHRQYEALDIAREDAVYDICIEALRTLDKRLEKPGKGENG